MSNDFSAAAALSKSNSVGYGYNAKADDINYTLTLKRIMDSINATTDSGRKSLVYKVPSWVIDGTSTDSRTLAKQLKKRLLELKYICRRDNNKLYIDWDLDLMESERLAKKRIEKLDDDNKKNLSKRKNELKRVSRHGRRTCESVDGLVPLYNPVRKKQIDTSFADLCSNDQKKRKKKKGSSSVSTSGFTIVMKK